MNVRGFNSEGEMTELQVAAQNESLVSLSSRFTQAMSNFPSFETENALISIMSDIQDTEHAKVVKFQCEREIAKCKILREQYAEAIPYLIQSLKTDEDRADIWVQLAICAQNTNNANLFRAANSRIRKLRPQMELKVDVPQLPDLIVPDEQPKFSGYQLQLPCWTTYLRLLNEVVCKSPYNILEIVFQQGQITQTANQYKLYRPPNIRHQQFNTISKQVVKILGGKTLIEFFREMVVQQVDPMTWIFSEPVISLCATTLNKIALFPFTNNVPREIAKLLIDIALQYVFNDIHPTTKLFLVELAAEVDPSKCSLFLRDIESANLHSQNALLRLSFATLQESIRKNLDYSIIESQLSACKKNLDKELCIAHAGIVINKQLLDEKEEQIRILKMISTHSTSDDDAISLFENTAILNFLSLTNIIKLFVQFGNDSMNRVFPQFLQILPGLISKNENEIDCLSQIFNKITEPFEKDTINDLYNTFKSLTEIGADKNLIFSCALAIARSSVNYEDRAKLLVRIHKALGNSKFNVCYNNNGRFLEYLIDSLLPRCDEFESDLTSAFTCYFSDVPISNNSHHSTLKFRCSKYIQPFIDHVYKLDAKEKIQQFYLFAPYLAIWKHWKGTCNCVKSIDGWRMYHIIKKKEKDLSKAELPDKYTPQAVLEDLLRNDPENRTESRVALGKVLIKSFTAAAEPDKKKLNEAIQLLSCGDSSPQLLLINAIAHALLGDDPQETIQVLANLPVFEKPKKEARKLYWIIRLLIEIGQRENAKEPAKAAFDLKSKLTPDFALYLQCIAADAFQEKEIYEKVISTYCKTSHGKDRIICPYPFIGLARLLPPKDAYKTLSKLVRPKSVNITNFFHFDFKPPFLMAKPDDITLVRHDILELFVDSATESGNYKELFGLFHPSMKIDRKTSKVLKNNRNIYGIDRLDIFAKYIKELTKELISKGDKIKNDLLERALDALCRGGQVELTDNLNEAMTGLFNFMWKRQTGNDPPQDASVNELINLITGKDEEEDEEEDDDFIDGSDEEDENEDGKGEKVRKRNSKEEMADEVDEDEAIEDDEDEDDDEADEEEEEAEFDEEDENED